MMNDLKAYLSLKGPQYYSDKIRSDQSWFNNIKKKAKEKGLTEEEMLRIDSKYMLWQNHPEVATRYFQIKEAEAAIRDDSIAMNKIRREAKQMFLTIDEMVRYKAGKIYDRITNPSFDRAGSR